MLTSVNYEKTCPHSWKVVDGAVICKLCGDRENTERKPSTWCSILRGYWDAMKKP